MNIFTRQNSSTKKLSGKLYRSRSRGFTLVEVVVGSAAFLIIALSAYQAYVGLSKLISLGQYRVLAVNLANEQFELARNMPYSDVGVQGGIPNGKIPHIQNLVRGGATFTVTTTVRNLDLPFDGTFAGSPNDLSPADNKYVDVTVSCASCRGLQPISLTGQVAPKNLETASTNGALLIKVFDANGQPVQGANVHIVNVATTTTIVIDDVTDSAGVLQIVDVPPGNNAYRITVTKSGYSTDRTYPVGGVGNPTPSKPDVTILLQQLTQISFSIDRLGAINFSSVSPTCEAVPDFNFNLVGAKVIGPNVPKYTQSLSTNSSGVLSLPNMEWDVYTNTPTDTDFDIAGVNPLNPITLNPGVTQDVQLVVIEKDPRSVLVTVKDNVTQLPISDAVVVLSKVNSSWSSTKTTGKGYISQTNWSSGSGQALYTDQAKYWSNDGGIDENASAGDLKLSNAFGTYNSSGILESSSFDTGSQSNFYTLSWTPIDQPLLAGSDSLKFQLATNATITPTTTWAYKGPDGSGATYYTTSNSPIYSGHNNDQFLRYKLYMSTQNTSVTPTLSDVAFTFTSSCTPPGQVIYTDLESGTYTLTVTKSGYTNYSTDININSNWQEIIVNMAP